MTRTRHQFSVSLSGMEIARGHDGFLRGEPEPVVIVAAYVLDGEQVRPVGRALYRFTPSGPFPSVTTPLVRPPIAVQVAHSRPVAFALLAIALEEDGGIDVQTAYGATDAYRTLSVWSEDHREPAPLHLHELLNEPDVWRQPTSIQVIVDGRNLSSTCKSDEWVGGVAWLVPAYKHPLPTRREARNEFRLHFQSTDGRNDWTALAVVQQ